MSLKQLVLGVFLLVTCSLRAQDMLDLNNLNWKGNLISGSMPFNCKVPFNVHTDLWRQQLINDPYIGSNEQQLQWISDSTWEYETSFTLEQDFYKHQQIELVLENPDTYCKVFMNGHLMGTTNNQFISWRFNCKQYLKIGFNQLKLVFEPISKYVPNSQQKLPIEPYAIHRKPAYQFGWDWGPKLITIGLKNAYLKAFNDIQFLNFKQSQVFHSDQSVDLNLSFQFSVKNHAKTSYQLSCLSDSNVSILQLQNTFTDSTYFLHFKVHLNNPKLWWTAALGNPYRYQFQLTVQENKHVAFQKNIDIGIRKLELVQESDHSGNGKSFYFKLNNSPLFMKGANLIPPSSFMHQLPLTHYAKLTDEALNMHMNMIRIWGGGTYLPDEFYELCDQKGILIWQDFMFAGSMYPADSFFCQSVKEEVQQQVSRLQHHPCLALFCGNNEISEAWHNWGWQKQYAINASDSLQLIQNYKWLFEKAIPNWISEIAPVIYWPSSPAYGWGRKQSYLEGDSHFWGVWWGEAPFSAYQNHTGRFVSEYGFQGMPDLAIFNKYMRSNANSIDSTALNNHQKHKRGYELIRMYMGQHYSIPKQFNAFVYTSQLLQAYGLKMAMESHRKQMPYCMGSLIWQLNDCWPVTSWSLLDFENNRKAAYYQVKRSFNPLLIAFTQTTDSLLIQLLDDRKLSEKGNLNLRVLDFDGAVKYQFNDSISLTSNANNQQIAVSFKQLIKQPKDSVSLFLVATYSSATSFTQSLHYFTEPKNLALKKAKINSDFIAPNQIKLQSKTLQKNIWIYSTEGSFQLSDNFMDLLPNQPKIIELESGSFEQYKPLFMSLNDLSNE